MNSVSMFRISKPYDHYNFRIQNLKQIDRGKVNQYKNRNEHKKANRMLSLQRGVTILK